MIILLQLLWQWFIDRFFVLRSERRKFSTVRSRIVSFSFYYLRLVTGFLNRRKRFAHLFTLNVSQYRRFKLRVWKKIWNLFCWMSSQSLTIVFSDAQRLTHNRFHSFNSTSPFFRYFTPKVLFMCVTLLSDS